MAVIIKGKMFDYKKPIVCVPVTEPDRDSLVYAVRRLVDDGVDMIEWRMDCYKAVHDEAEVRATLNELAVYVKNTILLATFRTRQQGGWGEFSDKMEENSFYEELVKAHVADIVDIEFFGHEHPEALIRSLQRRGAMVLVSHHDFESTPSVSVMKMTLDKMSEADADIVKLAVMPKTPSDVLDLLKVTSEYITEHPGDPIISMSMGPLGMISRISGELFGSCVTFGADGGSSAPGQLPREELTRAMDFIHKYSAKI